MQMCFENKMHYRRPGWRDGVSNDLQKRFVIFVVKIRTVQSIIIRIIFLISNIYKNWNQLIQRQSVS